MVTCSACRLAQPPAANCAACGEAEPTSWPVLRPPAPRTRRMWRVVATVLLVATIPFAAVAVLWIVTFALALFDRWLLLVVFGLLLAWLVRRAALRLRPLPSASIDAAATARGIVRGAGLLTSERLVDGQGRLLLWSTPPAELELETATGEHIHVRGVARVDGPAKAADADVAERLRAAVDPRIAVGGMAELVTLRPGDEVELHAPLAEQPIEAGYRESALARVARGERGRPIVIRIIRPVDSAAAV